MPSRDEYFDLLNRLASLRARLADLQAAELPDEPGLAERIARELADVQDRIAAFCEDEPAPADHGLTQLIGLGPDASGDLGEVRVACDVQKYDETVTSERLLAIADLYYIYQHERIGVFRGVLKLQELFRSGQVRLSDGEGALSLYQYDRKKVLQYTRKERLQAYRRVFGYTSAEPPAGSKPNRAFHALFTQFNTQVARYFRDKRISEVVRPTGRDLSFGSAAKVRRAGLDLRSNLKGASYGHVNVMTVEVSQLLEFAFKILGSDDVKRLFGADNAWDVLEEIVRRYLKEENWASQRSRMAFTGREIIRWLAVPQALPHILTAGRSEFESLLLSIGEYCEEWLTSAESLGMTTSAKKVIRSSKAKVIPLRRRSKAKASA